mgnify:CR=1 FL=1
MKLVEILIYILIVIGTCINIISGIVLKIDFIFVMVKNIILTALLLIIGFLLHKVLEYKNNFGSRNYRNKENIPTFQYEIPSLTDEELNELNKEDDFKEVNPADLYIKK